MLCSFLALAFTLLATILAVVASIRSVPLSTSDDKELSALLQEICDQFNTQIKFFDTLQNSDLNDSSTKAALMSASTTSQKVVESIDKSSLKNPSRRSTSAACTRLLLVTAAFSAVISFSFQILAIGNWCCGA